MFPRKGGKMASYLKSDVKELLNLVGGKENIAGVTHCVTRMRFVLNDDKKANVEKIAELSSVKGTFTNAGQFQVIIGAGVGEFYKEFILEAGLSEMNKEEAKVAARKNMNFFERAISHLAEIFVPLLPAIIVGGLILGFRNIIGDIKIIDGGTKTLVEVSPFWAGAHSFLWLLGEAIFHFLPVGVTWSVVKKMGGTPILGIVLGITLVSPQLMNAYAIGQKAPEVWDFGSFAIQKVGYQAQVIPAMLAGMCLAFIENKVKIGDCVTVKSGVYIWDGVTLEDYVQLGANVTFTNDKYPRSKQSFELQSTLVKRNASIGAGSVILGGITIGENAMVGAGSVVTKDVPANELWVGNPARFIRKI